MAKKIHDNYNGIFLVNDREFAGHLSIAGRDSIATLVGNGPWVPSDAEYTDIHGMLSDGSRASLLSCVFHGETQHHFDENTQFETRIFPNYVAVGKHFIRSDEPVISAVRYHFKNVAKLLGGHKTFRSLSPDRDDALRLLRKDYERSQEFAEKYGWPKREFEPEISEHPTLLYYSGVWEIVSSNTERGKISLTNSTSRGMGSATGIGIDNTVTVNFEFTEPKTIKTAIRELYTLHGLFELSLAQRQRYEWIDLELTHRSTYGEHELPESVRLYWSLCNDRVKDDPEATRMDNLLAPDRRAEGFAKVASGWMNSADILGDPRERFATAFFQ